MLTEVCPAPLLSGVNLPEFSASPDFNLELKRIADRFPDDWQGVAAVLCGVKPAYITMAEFSQIDPVNLYDGQNHNFAFSKNNWFVNIMAVRGIIESHPAIFSDFDQTRTADQDYLLGYIGQQRTDGLTAAADIRTGFLLGYPARSVLAYAAGNANRMDPYHHQGLSFNAVKADIYTLENDPERKKQEQILNDFLRKHEIAMRLAFNDTITEEKNEFGITRIAGNYMLEVLAVNPLDKKITRQLALLKAGTVKALELETFINEAGIRFGIPEMGMKWDDINHSSGTMGVNFPDYLESFQKNVNPGVIPLIEVVETGDGLSITPKFADSAEIFAYLPSSMRQWIASILLK